ncbi:MAG: hypothetical protein HYV63_00325 [Candidatus Schekmanbacteria bacterium]|nr:hypothetical protein [Candidatus Schekmanbacteria bacterium]
MSSFLIVSSTYGQLTGDVTMTSEVVRSSETTLTSPCTDPDNEASPAFGDGGAGRSGCGSGWGCGASGGTVIAASAPATGPKGTGLSLGEFVLEEEAPSANREPYAAPKELEPAKYGFDSREQMRSAVRRRLSVPEALGISLFTEATEDAKERVVIAVFAHDDEEWIGSGMARTQ